MLICRTQSNAGTMKEGLLVTKWRNKQKSDWLTNWPTDWLAGTGDWLTDRLTDWLILWLIDWLTDWLTVWLANWFSNWWSDWYTDWQIDEQTDWVTDQVLQTKFKAFVIILIGKLSYILDFNFSFIESLYLFMSSWYNTLHMQQSYQTQSNLPKQRLCEKWPSRVLCTSLGIVLCSQITTLL